MSEELKKTADQLMTFSGKVRGEKFRTHAAYIKQKKGDEGLLAVEQKMAEIGYPFKFQNVRSLDWYPVGYSPIVILVAKDIFKWTDADIFDMGFSAPKYSFIFKIALRWIVSIQRVIEESPSFWSKHYDFGKIEAVSIDEKERKIVSRISGFKLHPIMCLYLQGYILRMLQYVIKGDAKIEEIKCVHQDGDSEEYLISW